MLLTGRLVAWQPHSVFCVPDVQALLTRMVLAKVNPVGTMPSSVQSITATALMLVIRRVYWVVGVT